MNCGVLQPPERELLNTIVTEVHLEQGQVLFSQNDPADKSRAAEREQPIWDIIRPNLAAADLIRRHEKILLELGMDNAA